MICNSRAIRITSVLSVFIAAIFSVKSYKLLRSNCAFNSLTLWRIERLKIERTYDGEGDGCIFVTICSAAVVDQSVLSYMPSGSVPPFLLMFLPFSSSQKTYPFFNPLGQSPFLKIQYWPKENKVYIENWPNWPEQFETEDKERKRNNMTNKFGIWKYPQIIFCRFWIATLCEWRHLL